MWSVRGSNHWRQSQKAPIGVLADSLQLELVRRDQFSMAEGSEAPWSSKESEGRGETPQISWAPLRRVAMGAMAAKIDKGKATGKGKPDDGGKNRGGDHRPNDDGRPSGKK